METEQIIGGLSSFDPHTRQESLSNITVLIKKRKITKSDKPTPWLNLHLHTFHSFNCNNWSPSRVVFEAWKTGLQYAGTVDFDTLAGLDETLAAGSLLDVKVTGGFESRVLVEELKNKVIDSPMEPGIYYLCGKGFPKTPAADTEEGLFFERLKETAQARNKKVVQKLNDYLNEVKVDYVKDILPLTPSGNPTERHIVESYMRKAEERLGAGTDKFWSEILSVGEARVKEAREKFPVYFGEMLRKSLIKFGGPGYIFPEEENFPKLDQVVGMIEKAGGIPTGTWLDGTNEGEEDAEAFVGFLKSKRIKAVTVIPERNYNIEDCEEKRLKLKKFNEFMQACINAEMPAVCGTELNKHGQPFVDDFQKPEISGYLDYFLQSASVFF